MPSRRRLLSDKAFTSAANRRRQQRAAEKPFLRRLRYEWLEDRLLLVGDVFLQGQYVEVGINPAGSFGSDVAAPAGYHPLADGSTELGFVADPGKDGWTVGTPPQTGDYFIPGTPEEGWSLQWTAPDSSVAQFNNYGLEGLRGVVATSSTVTSSGGTESAVWTGNATSGAGQLAVTQNVHFQSSDTFFVISITLTNTGSTTLSNVEYMRNVDPDQEEPLTGSYKTSNYIADQPGVGGDTNTALVVAKGLTYGLTLGLGTINPNAKVSVGGFLNRNIDAVLNDDNGNLDTTGTAMPTASSPYVNDVAISLAYRFASLAPGQSLSFDYAYVLNAADLTTALKQLASVTIVEPSGTVSGNSVPFQATTNDLADTTQMQFFANGALVGTDTTADAGGIYSTNFNSFAYTDGTLTLEAVATFADGSTESKTTTVTVSNSGPPISFTTPTAGQYFLGTSIPVKIQADDSTHPPVSVSFFRETASTGSEFLGTVTAAPFSTTFDVSDLPPAETVTIKAVAKDSAGRSTTEEVVGTTQPIIATQIVLLAAPPTSVTAGEGFTLTVAAEDASGNVDTNYSGNVTVALGSGAGGSVLGGTLTATVSGGVATFSSLTLNKAGSDTLSLTSGTLTSAATGAIMVNAASATQLVIVSSPPNVTAGVAFSVTVAADDAFGNVDTNYSGGETIALASGSGTLSGTLSASAVNGVAIFSGLALSKVDTYTLSAGSGSLSTATSGPLSAVAGAYISNLATFVNLNGRNPRGDLIEDASGNLFGTALVDGAYGDGVIFEIAQGTGAETVLATFNGTNGAYPYAGVIEDASGNLFGTTEAGGANDDGTIFEWVKSTGTISTLASFTGSNGEDPEAGLTEDADGNLFGTTSYGGTNGDGTVFEWIKSTGTLSTLVTFNSTNGANPYAGLVEDTSGNLFGTTAFGGTSSNGTVFEWVKSTSTISTLASFTVSNGAEPQSGLVEDASGNLFGTTNYGGTSGDGTVFEWVKATGAISTLATFTGTNGQYPQAGVREDTSGNLFGTTAAGGTSGNGTVFEWVKITGTISTLASFNGTNGADPDGGMVEDTSGDLFGTTTSGGASSGGTVFEWLKSSGAITTLASFDGTGGQTPNAGLVEDASGNIFGTTSYGGTGNEGTIFEWVKSSDTISTLASFNGTNGGIPAAGVVQDASGNLFGTTSVGNGTIFEWVKSTGTISRLATFNGTNGSDPLAGLVQDSSGNLFGTTFSGGASGKGVIFEWIKSTGTISTLASFNGTNGANPEAGLVEDTSGNLFGTTYGGGASGYGTIFEWVKSTGTISTLASFSGTNGKYSYAGLIEDTSGNLFGTTSAGGAYSYGTIFEWVKSTGAISTLANFNNSNGAYSYTSLIEDTSGNLFGTTAGGGANSYGTVFEWVKSTGTISTLASFNGTNGKSPEGVIEDASGNFFGVTHTSTIGNGTVFEIPEFPRQLSITAQPTSAVVGSGFSLAVEALDADGNVMTGFVGPVTLSLTNGPAGGTLSGTLTASAANGIATFSGLSLNKLGTNYTISAAGGALSTTTSAITITAGAATQLVVTAQPPSSVTATAPFSLTVTAEDAQGNTDTNYAASETISIGSGPAGGTLGGTLTVTASAGVAAFSGLNLSPAGNYTLSIASGSLAAGTTNSITVTPSLLAASFTSSPNPAAPNQAITLDGSASHATTSTGSIASYKWDFGDGSPIVTQATSTTTHSYSLFGSYSAKLTVTDDLGYTASSTTAINVNQGDHSPIASAGGPYQIILGQSLNLSGYVSDSDTPAGDTVIGSWDLDNNGTFGDASGAVVTVGASTLTALGLAGGSYTIKLKATDSFGATAISSTTLIVNLPPTANAGGPYQVNQTGSVQLSGAGSLAAGSATISNYEWDYDYDGSTFDTDATGSAPLFSAAGAATGDRTIALRVTDSNGATNIATASLTINPDPAIYYVTNTNDSGDSSLRAAILAANASPVTNTIAFAIPGDGPFVIAPASELPFIADKVIIDGTSQPGFAGSPVVEIDGGGSILAGLDIRASGSTVTGLAIGGFTYGIAVEADDVMIQGNYIGVDTTGTAAIANTYGVVVFSGNTTLIGGAVEGTGNVISGNTSSGIYVGDATNTQIYGNFIGTDASGTHPLGNGDQGVRIAGSTSKGTVIGGDALGTGNVIGANRGGIGISTAIGTIIEGNWIGTDVTGTLDLGNSEQGIDEAGTGTVIGGTSPIDANTIAFNGYGVLVITPGADDSIRGNSIYANDYGGIFLAFGGNNSQAAPTFSSATSTGGITTLAGNLSSTPATDFYIDIYSSPSLDAAGNLEGKVYLGSTLVETDDDGNGTFSFDVASTNLAGQFVSATATDSSGNTSQFSVEAASQLVFASEPTSVTAGAAFALAISAEDILGNVVSSDTDNVTLALADNPGSSVLSGSTSVSLIAGKATFSGLSLNKFGNGYTLAAKSGSLPAFTTNPFDVLPIAESITFAALPGKVYGDLPFIVGASADSGLPVSFHIVSGPASLDASTNTVTITGAGTVVVEATQSGDGSYAAATPVDQSFVVSKAHLTVTANNASRLYGAADPTFAAVLSGFVNGDTLATSGVTGSASLSSTDTSSSPVGTYAINVSQGTLSAANYDFTTFVPGTLSIGKAHLMVTANNASRLYGAADPTYSATITGFVNGQSLATSGVTGSASLSSTDTASSPVGTYTINAAQGTLAATNYDFATFVPGTLSIGKAHLMATANNASRLYGAADPTYSATITGFVNGQSLATSGVTGSASLSSTDTSSSPVGTYTINAAQGTLAATNYDFTTFVPGTLTVNKAHLTVTANNGSRLYGAADPALTATISGFVLGQTLATSGITGSVSLSSTDTSSSPVGTYTINAAQGTLAATNYDLATFVPGTLSIGKAHLTVTANNATRSVGASDPTFTATISGFVLGQSLATGGVTGSPSFTSTDTPSSLSGIYSINVSQGTLAATNYDFTPFVAGTLTVTQPVIQRFDFDQTNTTATIQSGFTGVLNTTTYSGSLGYGWSTAVNPYDRGSSAVSSTSAPQLLEDGAWGSPSTTSLFAVAVQQNTTYDVRVYLGDASAARGNIRVDLTQMNLSTNPISAGAILATQYSSATAAGQFTTLTFTGVTPTTSGALGIQLSGGTGYGWVINGFDVATSGNLPVSAVAAAGPTVTTSGGALSYTSSSGPQKIDPTLTVSEIGSVNIASATVQITSGYASGVDSLSFTASGGVTGSFVAGTGTLSLSGSAPASTYQAVLQSVTYTDTSAATGQNARSISFSVTDANHVTSTPALKSVTISTAKIERYDFNGSASSPTDTGWIGVPPTTTYNASLGYGWDTAINGFDRGSTAATSAGVTVDQAMFEDGNWSGKGSTHVFTISVTPNTTYDLRAYIGDAATGGASNRSGITLTLGNVTSSGPLTQVAASTLGGQFTQVTFNAFHTGASTTTLTVSITSATSDWVINGIDLAYDVASGGTGLPATAHQDPAGGVKPGGASVAGLTQGELHPIVERAIALWQTAGIRPEQVAALQSTRFVIADTASQGALALTGSSTVLIDPAADGYGWFVDPTAGDDREFSASETGSQRTAGPGSPAAGHMDLLTVVLHELGHVLELADSTSAPTDLMATSLPSGARRSISAADVDAVFSGQPLAGGVVVPPDSAEAASLEQAARADAVAGATPVTTAPTGWFAMVDGVFGAGYSDLSGRHRRSTATWGDSSFVAENAEGPAVFGEVQQSMPAP